jgi:hypothetical protein
VEPESLLLWVTAVGKMEVRMGPDPIATLQLSSTTLYQVSYHIQWLVF